MWCRTWCRCLYPQYHRIEEAPEDEHGAPVRSAARGGRRSVVFGRGLASYDDGDHGPPVKAPRQVRLRQPTKPAKQKPSRPANVTPEAIVAEGSFLNGLEIAPWLPEDPDVAGNFRFGQPVSDSLVFEDPDGFLELTKPQQRKLDRWCRFNDLPVVREVGQESVVFAGSPSWNSIRQLYVMDCSLISALAVLSDYERRYKDPVVSGIIHPRGPSDEEDGHGDQKDLWNKPVYNAFGQYGCRLFFNGVSRKVLIDDRVPVGVAGQPLCAHSTRSNEMWVTLLEKAIAKLYGGSYEMQGSNPGVDVFHLVGWIPESVPLGGGLKNPRFDTVPGRAPELDDKALAELFDVAHEGFHSGHCVICVGTMFLADAVNTREARRMGFSEGVSPSTGLVAEHAYPVLDCRRAAGYRLLFLRNPWGHTRWRGRFSPDDPVWQQDPDVAQAVGFDAEEAVRDDGRFWIEWSDVVKYFSHFYLCWAPRALKLHSHAVHGRWDADPYFSESVLQDDRDLIAFNPQFRLRLHGPDPEGAGSVSVWIVLSRHVRDRNDMRKRYVGVSVFEGGSRMSLTSTPLVKQGIFSNGECAIVKFNRSNHRDVSDFVLVVNQHQSKVAFNFTLQVYTAAPASVEVLPPLVPEGFFSDCARGQWTPRTAGGCSNSLWSYFQNPQWCFQVPEQGLGDIIILLESATGYTLNIRVFAGDVAHPGTLGGAHSSGDYSRSCCTLRLVNLAPGHYTVVVSTFDPNLCGDYRLAWHSSSPVELRAHPHPFVVGALPYPLSCPVRPIPPGKHVCLEVRSRRSGNTPTMVSMRLQTSCREGPLPLLEIFHAQDMTRPIPCELLSDVEAEQYFALSGAVVVLLAKLVPNERYVLDVYVAKQKGTYKAHDEAKLYLNADSPLVLSTASAGAIGWR